MNLSITQNAHSTLDALRFWEETLETNSGSCFFYRITSQQSAGSCLGISSLHHLRVSSGWFHCCLPTTVKHTSAFHFGVMLPHSLVYRWENWTLIQTVICSRSHEWRTSVELTCYHISSSISIHRYNNNSLSTKLYPTQWYWWYWWILLRNACPNGRIMVHIEFTLYPWYCGK